jgi:hypothetical protein
MCPAKISFTTFTVLFASDLWGGICFGCSSLAVFGHHKLVHLQSVLPIFPLPCGFAFDGWVAEFGHCVASGIQASDASNTFTGTQG